MMLKKSSWKDCIRIILVLVILYYVPVTHFVALQDNNVVAGKNIEIVEDGMGGRESAVVVENVSLTTEQDIPEQEEFFKPRMVLYTSYTVQKGNVIGEIAKQFGLNAVTLVSVNDIKYPNTIVVNRVLTIPNQDGVLYKVKKGDTLAAVAGRYKADPDAIRVANELFSDKINENTSLFLPGAVIPKEYQQQEVRPVTVAAVAPRQGIGEIFSWPVRGRITSYYGYRRSPFTGARMLHPGLDIGAVEGTPVKAAMAGRVITVGWDEVYGNFVLIGHQSDYRTLYGHMSEVFTHQGAYVDIGENIGAVGSTGQSTGPHLHFTVYRNGASINPRTVLR